MSIIIRLPTIKRGRGVKGYPRARGATPYISFYTYSYYSIYLCQNMVAYQKSTSWDSPKWMKNNAWRRAKFSDNNGQLNILKKIYFSFKGFKYKSIFRMQYIGIDRYLVLPIYLTDTDTD